jgi:phosphatidylglycerol:prolipoprotein diacylglycerol transferase
MRPILFHVLGRPIHSFGVMVALGFLAALGWTLLEAKRLARESPGTPLVPALFVDALWRVAIGGVLGARLLYVAIHPEELQREGGWLGLVAIWRGGLVWYGGLAGGLVAGLLFVRSRRAPMVAALDLAMPGIWLGLAVGRMGCFLVGDDWGRPTDGPWGIRFPPAPGSMLDPRLIGVPLHPTQLYDALNAFVVFVVAAIVLRRSLAPGRATGVALALYAAGRFLVEHFRGDDVARGMFAPAGLPELSTSQWLSLPLFAIGVALAAGLTARARPPASAGAG